MSAKDRPAVFSDRTTLEAIAAEVGTPFYLYDAAAIGERIEHVQRLTAAENTQARYAMKACSARRVLERMRDGGLWIDAVSGNEILRARRAGFPAGAEPPAILYSSDVLRDNAVEAILEHDVLPNVGTPQMIETLAEAGYRGPIGLRINPGFGHGHVKQCDTGGPSSKHGIWLDDLRDAATLADRHGLTVRLLHAHIGTGPEIAEFQTNIRRLVDYYASIIGSFPHVNAVNLGGGIPHAYRPGAPRIDIEACAQLIEKAQRELSDRVSRPVRVEVEPGRYLVAPGAALITRVHGRKRTRDNEKGPGQTFVMVDAGFCDLVRPTMYGSYHHIEVASAADRPLEPVVVAGPMCESGDVFTRDAEELLDPRSLPEPRVGDILAICDAGAYGEAMSSNYNSLGKVPQVWLEDDRFSLMSRRQTLEDIVGTECFEDLPVERK